MGCGLIPHSALLGVRRIARPQAGMHLIQSGLGGTCQRVKLGSPLHQRIFAAKNAIMRGKPRLFGRKGAKHQSGWSGHPQADAIERAFGNLSGGHKIGHTPELPAKSESGVVAASDSVIDS